MNFNLDNVCTYVKTELDKRSIKYEVHRFDKAIMIDIWLNDLFYVVQSDMNYIGLSEINDDNPGFDTIPDELFYDNEKFKERFEGVLNLKK